MSSAKHAADWRRRQAARAGIDYPAALRRDGRPDLALRLRDISNAGFKFECAEPVEIGSEVVLVIPDVGEFAATIAWHIGVSGGGEFSGGIDPRKVLAALIAAHPRPSSKP